LGFNAEIGKKIEVFIELEIDCNSEIFLNSVEGKMISIN